MMYIYIQTLQLIKKQKIKQNKLIKKYNFKFILLINQMNTKKIKF